MGRIYETAIRLSAKLGSGFRPEMASASAALKRLGAEAKKLKSANESAVAFAKLGAAVSAADAKFAAAAAEEKRLGEAAAAAGKPTAEMKAQMAAAAKATKLAEKELARTKAALDRTGAALRAAGVDTSNLTGEQARLAAALARSQRQYAGLSMIAKADLGGKLTKVGSELKSLAADAAKFGGAAAAAAAIPLVQFAKFEKGMAEVSTLVDTSKVNTAELAAEVRRLAKEYGADHVEEAKALYQTISAGFSDTADAAAVLNQANKLAIAGVTDTETAVNGLTTTLNAFGMGAKGAARASDVMVTTMRLAKTTIPELSDFMFQAAPTAAALGVRLDEVSAGVVALTLQGTPTSVAMTRIRAAMDGLVKPSAQMTALWHEHGFANGTAAIKSLGLAGALRMVSKDAKGDAGAIQKLLGSVEAVGAAQVIAGTGAASYDDAIKQLGTSAGATDSAFEKMRASFDFQAKVVKAKANDIAITLGSKLAPIATQALGKISKWVDDNKDRIEAWATQGAAWIETKMIPGIQKLSSEIWPLIERLSSMTAWIAEAVGGWENFAIAIGLIRLAPLILSVGQLGSGLVTAAAGMVQYGIAAQGAALSVGGLAAMAGSLAMALAAGVAAGVALDNWFGVSDAISFALSGAEKGKQLTPEVMAGLSAPSAAPSTAPAMPRTGAPGGGVQQVNHNKIEIVVPPGTPQADVGPMVQKAVEQALASAAANQRRLALQ